MNELCHHAKGECFYASKSLGRIHCTKIRCSGQRWREYKYNHPLTTDVLDCPLKGEEKINPMVYRKGKK